MTAIEFAHRCAWGGSPPHLIGFSPEIVEHVLYTLRSAIEDGHVNVVSNRRFDYRTVLQFDYLGFRYETELMHGPDAGTDNKPFLWPASIEKIARVEEGCDFSETYGDDHTIVIEDYRRQRACANPDFGTW